MFFAGGYQKMGMVLYGALNEADLELRGGGILVTFWL